MPVVQSVSIADDIKAKIAEVRRVFSRIRFVAILLRNFVPEPRAVFGGDAILNSGCRMTGDNLANRRGHSQPLTIAPTITTIPIPITIHRMAVAERKDLR